MRIGLAGFGVVGAALARFVLDEPKSPQGLQLAGLAFRDASKPRAVSADGVRRYDSALALATAPDIDLFVELIGGADGPAFEATRAALAAGKPVVTANKAMIAAHGAELADVARRSGVALAFEGAVAGGLPIIGALRDGLTAADVQSLSGILNGTSNFILSAMEARRLDFAAALAQAQALGYAEADPTLDVSGMDAAQKLAILAAIAFGGAPQPVGFAVQGVEAITADDVALARALDYRIKLIAKASRSEAGIRMRVGPALVGPLHPLFAVNDVLNAVMIESRHVGVVFMSGPGAGGAATAAAVLSDIKRIASGARLQAFPSDTPLQIAPAGDAGPQGWFIRVTVADRPGALAAISTAAAQAGLSFESVLQRPPEPNGIASIAATTRPASNAAAQAALAAIQSSAFAIGAPSLLPIEN